MYIRRKGIIMRKTFNALDISRKVIASRVHEGDICIDATAGRGNDTAYLCGLAGESGKVIAFDIQQEAIDSTAKLLEEKGLSSRAELILGSHTQMDSYAEEGTVSCITFNFGWLPGADHAVFSTAGSSTPALEAALTALRPGGVLSAILYSGRVIGSDEKRHILQWARALPLTKCTVLVCDFANWADTAPLPCLLLKK